MFDVVHNGFIASHESAQGGEGFAKGGNVEQFNASELRDKEYLKLQENHKRILYKRQLHKLRKGKCFYILENTGIKNEKKKQIVEKNYLQGRIKSKTDTGGFRLEIEAPGAGARFGSIGTENYQWIISQTDDSGIKKLNAVRKQFDDIDFFPENPNGDKWFSCESSFFVLNKTHHKFADFAKRYREYYDCRFGSQ